MYPRRLLNLPLAAVLIAVCGAALADRSLDEELAVVFRHPSLRHAVVGAEVLEWPSGKMLYSVNAERALVPASNVKLVITATALELLGADYRYSTTLWAWPPPEGDTVPGDVIIEGEGDPTATANIYQQMANELRRIGVRRIKGSVLAAGCVLASESDVLASARAFHTALGKAGISAAGHAQAGRVPALAFPVIKHRSEPLRSIIRQINKTSNNQLADALLASLACRFAEPAQGNAFLLEIWEDLGLPCDGVHIADGSGLSHKNRLTPRFFVSLLARVIEEPDNFAALCQSLPLAGRDGTLRDRMRGTAAEGRVYAKTGTLTGVSALSGYVCGSDGPHFVFSVLMNNYTCATETARRLLDRAAVALAKQAR